MSKSYEEKIEELKSKIQSYPDFPKKGILFWDIFSAISNGSTCTLLQELLVHAIQKHYPDAEAVVGIETRGFLFSFSIAATLGISCIPVRKKGKLPGDCLQFNYDLEYGSDTLEIQKNAVKPGLRCVIIDDLIATGGSLAAAASLVESCGAHVEGCLVVIELKELGGKSNIKTPVHSLVSL